MKRIHRVVNCLICFLTVVSFLAPSVNAATFYSISSISSSTDYNDFLPVFNLIQGPGIGFDANEPHDKLGGNWVTAAPGGFPSDYIAVAGMPVLTIDLGQDSVLSEISIWGYDNTNANGVSEFSLAFATGAEGPNGFGTSIGYSPSFFPVNNDTSRQSFAFGQTITARFVEFTAVDNFFIAPGDGSFGGPPGGDRVGLGEIAFSITPIPVPSTLLLLSTGIATLFGYGRLRQRKRI